MKTVKTFVLLFIIFAFAANVPAQLKVDASGNVGIGKDPLGKLDVNGDKIMCQFFGKQ